MTIADALQLQKGDHVMHRATKKPFEPIPVTEVWVNAKQTIVLVRLAKISATQWLDATGYEMAPKVPKKRGPYE